MPPRDPGLGVSSPTIPPLSGGHRAATPAGDAGAPVRHPGTSPRPAPAAAAPRRPEVPRPEPIVPEYHPVVASPRRGELEHPQATPASVLMTGASADEPAPARGGTAPRPIQSPALPGATSSVRIEPDRTDPFRPDRELPLDGLLEPIPDDLGVPLDDPFAAAAAHAAQLETAAPVFTPQPAPPQAAPPQPAPRRPERPPPEELSAEILSPRPPDDETSVNLSVSEQYPLAPRRSGGRRKLVPIAAALALAAGGAAGAYAWRSRGERTAPPPSALEARVDARGPAPAGPPIPPPADPGMAVPATATPPVVAAAAPATPAAAPVQPPAVVSPPPPPVEPPAPAEPPKTTADRREAARRASAERKAEAARKAEERRAEAARKAEERQAEAARKAEADRVARAERQAALDRKAEDARRVEAERKAEAARRAEADRAAAAERRAEADRRAEVERKAQAERAATERRAEAERKAEAERRASAARRSASASVAEPAVTEAPRRKEETAAPKPQPLAEGLDPAEMQAVIRAHRAALEGCVERALADPATASYAGRKISLIILVAPNGRAEAAIEEPDLDASAFGTCLRRTAARMTFPAFRGEPVGARIPLVLGR